MTRLRAEVRLAVEGPGFQAGGLNYIDCPECGGKSKMMVGLHPDGAAWFKCMRVTCQVQGVTQHSRRPDEPRQKKPVRLVPYPNEATSPKEDRYRALNACRRASGRSPLPTPALVRSRVFLDDRGRWCVPLFDQEGACYGTMAHSWAEGRRKNSWFEQHEPSNHRLGWFHTKNPGLVVLVEDVFSAATLATRSITAAALLGTNLGANSMPGLLQYARRTRAHIVVCLDADATEKAFGLARRVGGSCVPLTGPDIKDMLPDTLSEFCQTLETYRVR